MSDNIFEVATRKAFRFATKRGLISVEQLWDVPLRSRDGFNLDAIAQAVNGDLKETSAESFVSTTENPERALLELAMDVVKHVIAVKLKEEEVNKNRAANRKERARLLAILADKKDGALSELPIEELEKRIADLHV